jgi:hypothetical protein
MKVLKATLYKKNKLEGIYKNGAMLQFIKDAENNWVVNEAVLNDENFAEIKKQLELLPLIDYLPKETVI